MLNIKLLVHATASSIQDDASRPRPLSPLIVSEDKVKRSYYLVKIFWEDSPLTWSLKRNGSRLMLSFHELFDFRATHELRRND